MKLAWITDPHLDHLKPRAAVRQAFAEMVHDESDACVISGDISTQADAHLLGIFAKHYGKPVYFVLGNHDYWGGSFSEAERRIRALCRKHKNLHWLTDSKPISLTPDHQIVGVDGWYDAHYGDPFGGFYMVDWNAIRDFHGKTLWEIIDKSKDIAKDYSVMARVKLEATTAKNVFFVTHIPPYRESAIHNGQPSSRAAVPWYTSFVMGNSLGVWADSNPDRKLTTLCGHVHSASEYQQAENHLVLCGAAAYGSPTIFRVFDLDQKSI